MADLALNKEAAVSGTLCGAMVLHAPCPSMQAQPNLVARFWLNVPFLPRLRNCSQ